MNEMGKDISISDMWAIRWSRINMYNTKVDLQQLLSKIYVHILPPSSLKRELHSFALRNNSSKSLLHQNVFCKQPTKGNDSSAYVKFCYLLCFLICIILCVTKCHRKYIYNDNTNTHVVTRLHLSYTYISLNGSFFN